MGVSRQAADGKDEDEVISFIESRTFPENIGGRLSVTAIDKLIRGSERAPKPSVARLATSTAHDRNAV